jgi:large subunit ribosomal protein L3
MRFQVGAGHRKQKAISPSAAGFFLKHGVPFKHEMVEFKISEDAVMPVGTTISAAHFVAGQNIDVTGYTKYKGFQGKNFSLSWIS